MKHPKYIYIYLLLVMITLGVIPTITSYFIFEDTVSSALNIGMNSRVYPLLEKSQTDLKKLRQVYPEQENEFKDRFYEIEKIKPLYDQKMSIKKNLNTSYRVYFLIFLILSLVLSCFFAFFLGNKITRTYKDLFRKSLDEMEKKKELVKINEWQIVAQKMAHEIKNPLTPIEMMISGLNRIDVDDKVQLKEYLSEVQTITKEEVGKIKNYLYNFSKFSKLPAPSLEKKSINAYLSNFVNANSKNWPLVEFLLTTNQVDLLVMIDPELFSNVLSNLINNAVEANNKSIRFSIIVRLENENIIIDLINSGRSISKDKRDRIFDIHYSTKKGKSNMGLGLNIVQKIVLEHNGGLKLCPYDEGAWFQITLPRYLEV